MRALISLTSFWYLLVLYFAITQFLKTEFEFYYRLLGAELFESNFKFVNISKIQKINTLFIFWPRIGCSNFFGIIGILRQAN